MLGLITGVPGAKKTVFIVDILDKTESKNKVSLNKNIGLIDFNAKILSDNDLEDELTYYHEDVGTGHELKQVLTILQDDYFNMLAQDYDSLRPDDYFKVSTIYNSIISRILETKPKLKLKYLQPVRTIYSNINALKIDFVRSLSELLDDKGYVDWRKAPDGSIIVIDEVQLVEPYKQTKNKDEPIIQDLTIHRHRGFDIYYITQSANLLHVQIKDLIGLHWHITVPWGWVSKVYQYGSYRQNPNAVSIKMAAEKKFSFNPDPRLFKLYKSTTINTHQKRIPIKALVGFASIVVFGISMFFWAVGDSKDSTLLNGMMGKVEIAEMSGTTSKSLDEKPQLLEAPTGKTSNLPSPSAESIASDKAVYDPLTGNYIQDINLVPVSGMMMNGRCSVYNKDGALLTHISKDDCIGYLSEKGMLPKIAA